MTRYLASLLLLVASAYCQQTVNGIPNQSTSGQVPSSAVKAVNAAGSHGIAWDASSIPCSPQTAVNVICSKSDGLYISEIGGGFSRICDAANLQCIATLPNLVYSVLGDTADALIVDGTSIPRGNGLGNGAWGPANTSSSGNSGIPQGSGFGYNPKTTTLLTGLGTYTYDVTNLPALKGKLTWVQNLAYDGTDSSHVSGDLGAVNAYCALAGTTYNRAFFIPDTGTNDFGGSLSNYCEANTAAATLAAMKSIWTSATTAGCSVIATTVMTRQFATGYASSYYSGYVTLSAGTVTWVSGTQFSGSSSSVNQLCGTSGGTPLIPGNVIYINGTQYTIATVPSATSLTLTQSVTFSGNLPYLAGQEIERQVYNSAVRALVSQGYFWGLLDEDALMSNGMLTSDGIHPTVQGHDVIATEINKILLTGGSPGYPTSGPVPMNFLDPTPNLIQGDNYHFPTDAAVKGYAQAIVGTTAGVAASAGNVGEVISSKVASGSAVSLVTATAKQLTSISLTAGDWDVEAESNFIASSATIAVGATYELSINSGTGCSTPAQVTDGTEAYVNAPILTATSATFGRAIPMKQYNVSATTTVCVIATGTFTAGSESVDGYIVARRRR